MRKALEPQGPAKGIVHARWRSGMQDSARRVKTASFPEVLDRRQVGPGLGAIDSSPAEALPLATRPANPQLAPPFTPTSAVSVAADISGR